MKLLRLLAPLLLLLWTLPAHAAVDGSCNYTQGSVSVAQGFTNCGEEFAAIIAGTSTATTTTGISAAGTTQGTATVLTATTGMQTWVVSTVASGAGVRLPAAALTSRFVITNQGANALKVYGGGTNTIDGVATGTGVSIPVGGTAWFLPTSTSAWFTIRQPILSGDVASTAADPLTNAITDNELLGLRNVSGTGVYAVTGTGTGALRTITAPANGFTITNPAGVAGDPTFVLADDLAAIEGMSGTGLVARTASNTYAQRTITGTSNEITVTNGDGVAGPPTVSLPSARKFIFTPQMYGAVADGATDDTAAIQAAIDANCAVYFPAGTYIHVKLTLRTCSNLTGAGIDVTILKLKNTTNDYGIYMTGVSDVFGTGFTLDGNSANNLTSGQGVRVEGASFDILFDNVRSTNWRQDGFAITGTGSRIKCHKCQADANLNDGISFTGVTRPSVENSLAKGNGRFGIVFGSGSTQALASSNLAIDNVDVNILAVSSTDVVFDGNVVSGSTTGHGLQFNTVTRGVMSGNSSFSNAISGLDVYASTYVTVTGNNSYLNTVRGIEVDSGSYYASVVGNIVYRNGEVGVSVFRSPNASIVGNQILENGTSGTPKYGVRLWDTAGTLASANVRIIGNNISDDRGGSATQTYAVSLENSANNLTLNDNNLTPNVTGAVNLSSGSISFAEGNLGYSKAPSALTLLASWVAYDANWEAPQSYIDASGVVFVTGVMKDGTITAGTVVATLPAGQRPAKVAGPFLCYADGVSVSFYVLTNGDITAQSALVAARTSLACITFKAA